MQKRVESVNRSEQQTNFFGKFTVKFRQLLISGLTAEAKKINLVMAALSNSLWAEIRMEFGEHCMRRNDYRKANENFEKSLKHQADKLDSVYRLAKSQAREGKLDEAEKLLKGKKHLGEVEISRLENLKM